jgi:hypothetical protein
MSSSKATELVPFHVSVYAGHVSVVGRADDLTVGHDGMYGGRNSDTSKMTPPPVPVGPLHR